MLSTACFGVEVPQTVEQAYHLDKHSPYTFNFDPQAEIPDLLHRPNNYDSDDNTPPVLIAEPITISLESAPKLKEYDHRLNEKQEELKRKEDRHIAQM